MSARKDNVDFGDLGLTARQDAEVRSVLDQWERQRIRLELANLAHAANDNGYRRTISDGTVGGEVKMSIPPSLYHLYGNHYGYQCWQDDDFCRAVLKHYPQCRVRSTSPTLTIIRPDFNPPPERQPKFTKTYATAA